MNKSDFIVLIQITRKNITKKKNIKHSWKKSDLFSIKSQIVLDRVRLKISEPSKSSLPDMTVTAFNGDSISITFTPRNVKQVNQLVQRIKTKDQDLELSEKLDKACSSALAFSILLQKTNN